MTIKVVAPADEYGNLGVAVQTAKKLILRGVTKTEVTAWKDIVRVVVDGKDWRAVVIPAPHLAISHITSGSFVDVGLTVTSMRMLKTLARKSTISNWGSGAAVPGFQLLTEKYIRQIRGANPDPTKFSSRMDGGLSYRSIVSDTLFTLKCGKVNYKTEDLTVTDTLSETDSRLITLAGGVFQAPQKHIAGLGENVYAGTIWSNPLDIPEEFTSLKLTRSHFETQTNSESYDGNGGLTTSSIGNSSTTQRLVQSRDGLEVITSEVASGNFENVVVYSGGGNTYSYSTSSHTTTLALEDILEVSGSYTTTTITQLPGPTTTTVSSGNLIRNIGAFRNALASYSSTDSNNVETQVTVFSWDGTKYTYTDTMSTMYNAAALYSASIINGGDSVVVDEPENIPPTGGSTTFGRTEEVDLTLRNAGNVAPLGDFSVSTNATMDHILPYRVQFNLINTVGVVEIVFNPTIDGGKLVDNNVVSISDSTAAGETAIFIAVGAHNALPVICHATNKIKLFSSILGTYDTRKDGDSPSEQEQFALNVFKILYNVSSDIRQVMGVAFY